MIYVIWAAGIILGLFLALLLLAWAVSPSAKDLDVCITAIDQTYPDSSALEVGRYMEAYGRRYALAKVWGMLIQLEDEGVITSFTKDGIFLDPPYDNTPKRFWMVTGRRKRRRSRLRPISSFLPQSV